MAHPAQGRIWLRKRKARLARSRPATMQLRCPHAVETFLRKWGRNAEVKLGIDPGAKSSGIAIIRNNKVLWTAEVVHRGAVIRKRLAQRRAARSARRCRRKRRTGRPAKEARWRHRGRPPGWLPPSVRHRVESTLRWARWALRYATAGGACVSTHVEVCAFDTHRVMNPEVYGKGYQRGPLWRANLRGAVLARDGGRCVYCGAGEDLEIDHVVAKKHGGSDRIRNRVAACRTCNRAKDEAPLGEWLARETRPAVRKRALAAAAWTTSVGRGHRPLNAMAAVNVVGPAIARALEAEGLPIERTSGADTAHWRRCQGVEKSRANDAAATAAKDTPTAWRCERTMRIEMTGRGRRLVVPVNASGFPRRKKDERTVVAGHRERPPCGLRAGDEVRIEKAGIGRRRRRGTATTVRHDGRCVVVTGRNRVNVMASRLALARRSLGARVA